jgi:hypothetical protein
MQLFDIVHDPSKFLEKRSVFISLDVVEKQTCNFAKLPKSLVTHRCFCDETYL